MRPILKRIGKAILLAIGDNAVITPIVAAVVGRLHLGAWAPAVSTALNNIPFYFTMWATEARHEKDRRCWRRHLGYA
jgi:hypothetical protein